MALAIHTQQIVVVVADSPHSIHGQLWFWDYNQLFRWQLRLYTPVVLGRNGITQHRHEGDAKSPMGVFPLTTAFGFAPTTNTKLNYLQIKDDAECIDDAKSRYYTQIVNAKQLKRDWHSSEQMRKIGQYRYGLIIPVNLDKKIGEGSCVFMHIWKNENTGTAGCTAMPRVAIKKLLQQLDIVKNPYLIQAG